MSLDVVTPIFVNQHFSLSVSSPGGIGWQAQRIRTWAWTTANTKVQRALTDGRRPLLVIEIVGIVH